MARLNYVELPVEDVARTKSFFLEAFGWSFTDYGDDYAATSGGPANLGLNGDRSQWTAGPLAVIEVEDIQAREGAIRAAGGVITQPTFAFPGGHRFHFRDPDGNELAVAQPDRE
ncbi:VOC family protein [uncultured Sphingomonas sp.]|uniref:VOC family protein n=1 Tax=uncultured Sphingomonas sp. TaxID=158754 RepID=UPI0035CBE71B